jgi:Mor family transcriptional regulator
MEAKRQVEERTRYVISRQFSLVAPFLQSLRPIFNRLIYSILEDAIVDSLGIEKESRKVTGRENLSDVAGGDSYYLIEEVKTYKNNPKTRVFTNLVESAVDSLLRDLQIELYQMLVSNNIGKCKEDVQHYVKDRTTHIIGIIRNNLCDAYNQLSNENLFDTHQYWKEIGITYPEDWIQDQIFQLLKSCMKMRYSDFDD